ncbi:hypothetical protein SBA4_380006 [Candidatus Sulfopaludibacter sp. SbA4]|nr:hypothetical protein SBA4_380006 [Candidatus Sulfopaludibacter sp. SbA4]
MWLRGRTRRSRSRILVLGRKQEAPRASKGPGEDDFGTTPLAAKLYLSEPAGVKHKCHLCKRSSTPAAPATMKSYVRRLPRQRSTDRGGYDHRGKIRERRLQAS